MSQMPCTLSESKFSEYNTEDNLFARYENNVLLINDRTRSRSVILDIDKLLGVDEIIIKLSLNKDEANKILLVKELPVTDEVLLVYSSKSTLHCSRKKVNDNSPFKHLVNVKFKVLRLSVNKRCFRFTYIAAISNPYGLRISNIRIYLDDNNFFPVEVPVKSAFPKSKLRLLGLARTKKITMRSLFEGGEPPINSQLKIVFEINDISTSYAAQTIKVQKPKNKRDNYVPVSTCYFKDYAVHVRRTLNGTPTLVRRKKDSVERTIQFRILESRICSFILYNIGRLARILSTRKYNVFFEKYAGKAEEGAYDIFERTSDSKTSKNIFIIDDKSEDYPAIKADLRVTKKFTIKYYWYLYRADNLISTEAPAHANLLRSNNRYIKKALIHAVFVFLQHGIIYMKNMDKKGAFSKNKEAEPNYMVVSSEKEKNIVAKMLKLPESRLLNVGLSTFDNIKYLGINQASDDVVTIMLTWKPYEEHHENFSYTSYYRYTLAIARLCKYHLHSTRVRVVAHPKVYDVLSRTDLSCQLWTGKISDALKDTKLLITDYSSVCYNSFYRGAGVIFFQPDIVKYEKETGPLIPGEHEYIGRRCFSLEELELILTEVIENKKIDLSLVRTSVHESRYKQINQYNDGRNVDRLYETLSLLGII